MSPLITVNNLTKVYKVPVKQNLLRSLFIPKNIPHVAVENINFSINEGEAVAFLGPNGAGKTTTLKMLTGLLYPDGGSVRVMGYTPTQRQTDFLKSIALVMGNKTGLSWDLSANQNYQLYVSMYDLDKRIARDNILGLSNLLSVSAQLDTPVRKLSLGQRMKLELIGAILHRPKILFLDEPTLGLDVVAKRKIRQFLRDINRTDNTTIILTSHDMEDIEKVCDRVIIINRGKIIYDGSRESLSTRYKNKKYLTVTFERKIDPDLLGKFGHIIESKELSYVLEVEAKKFPQIMASLSADLPVDDIDIRSVPLDEIMEDMFIN